ncbi:uncharacterized protein PHLOEM PROTEIN 2-LIKE A4-like [Aristolochia californica]|uniref:uncharacterized protein PHLOEM PROTEIN 2-LIKE A4-like n=1 Tax=Aristolochia californica TaxID=171875 RepID=UPI0035DBCD35
MSENAGHGSRSHYSALPVDEWSKPHGGALYVSAKAFSIVWGNDLRYWRMIDLPKEEQLLQFNTGAELLQVNWLEVICKLDCSKIKNYFDASESKTYEIFWVIKFNVDAFGWQKAPVKFKGVSNGHHWHRAGNLDHYMKDNHWHEIYGGEFTVEPGKNTEVDFGLFETETDWWKGSIVIAGVKIMPKNVHTEIPA